MQDLADKVERYTQYGIQIGSVLGEVMVNSTVTARDVAKEMIRIAFAELKRLADIYILQMTVKNIALYGMIVGGIRSAKNAALIRGTIALGEKAILGSFWSGGYTPPGGKYEPKGVVHGGEWVANQDMVASPVTGPIIKALENYRADRFPGFANGGLTTDVGGQSAAGASIIGSDPELKALIRSNIKLNNLLLTKGVKNNWTYNDVDNFRKGMTNLEDIESGVSL